MFTSDGKDGRGEAGGDTPPEAGLDGQAGAAPAGDTPPVEAGLDDDVGMSTCFGPTVMA
jgi:hypothetical protein